MGAPKTSPVGARKAIVRSRQETESNPVSREVGLQIRRAREARGISQVELADALKISQAAVSNIESGARSLRVDELVQVSRFLHEDIDFFFAPSRTSREPVGVTLRAEIAGLPIPEFRSAINAFVDAVEGVDLPAPRISIRAASPEKAANEILDKTDRFRPPIDVNAVARDLGAAVFARPLPDALSGLVVRHGASGYIGINSYQAPVRQRFSVAHELGHLVLHHDHSYVVDYGAAGSIEGDAPGYNWEHERAANRFAAELLMPERLIRADARSVSLPRLARRYDVSQEAMGFRLANLGI